jgi:hypothetical protein
LDNTDKYIGILNERILPFIDYGKLAESYQSEVKTYAKGVLKILHDAMKEAYGTDAFDCHGDEEFIVTPAVIQSQKTGAIALALLDLDLSSSGELWGIDIFTEHGIMKTSDEKLPKSIREEIHKRYYPLSYGYTADVTGDIHDLIAAPTKDIKDFLKDYSRHEISLMDEACEGDVELINDEDEDLEP